MKTSGEEKNMADSSQELERLQKLKTELESRLAAIDDEHKTVEEDVRVLREKLAIRDLEEKMREKRDLIAGLRIEKNELEEKMKNPKTLSMTEIPLKTREEIEDKEDALEEDKEEPSKSIGNKDEPTLESDETPEEPEKKKKLGIF